MDIKKVESTLKSIKKQMKSAQRCLSNEESRRLYSQAYQDLMDLSGSLGFSLVTASKNERDSGSTSMRKTKLSSLYEEAVELRRECLKAINNLMRVKT